MMETASVPARKSSLIFKNLRQSSENVWKRFSSLRNIFEKSLENRQKRRFQYVYMINRIEHAPL